MDGLDTFQASSPLAFSLPTRPELYKRRSSQSIPLQAPMRGKRCARRYMQTLPCTSPNSAAIYRRNCREQLSMVAPLGSICAVRRGCLSPSTRRILAYTKSDTITCARHKTRGEPPEMMQMCGASVVVCMSKRSIISLRHFAPVVCMIFLGDPDCWFTSHASGGRPEFER